MAKFSASSEAKLLTCDARLVRVFRAVVVDFDCAVICGRRGPAAQQDAFESGHSKARWGESLHNCVDPKNPTREDPFGLARAVDVVPAPIDWKDRERFILFAGYVLGVAGEMGIRLRWGGDFNGNWLIRDGKFQDLPHFELLPEA